MDLIASGSPWSPRPTIQSYVAYSEQLARINRDHLLGIRAPRNLAFKVEPLDDRMPALEDGASWSVILRNYRPVQFLNGFLILRHEVADTAAWFQDRGIGGHAQAGNGLMNGGDDDG